MICSFEEDGAVIIQRETLLKNLAIIHIKTNSFFFKEHLFPGNSYPDAARFWLFL